MKFFIDFEASQFTQEIISIGCVAETGETFYSLVNTKHKIGNFIAELTGITQAQINSAPDVDTIFDNFFFWLNTLTDGKKIEFICYGNCDTNFALNTLKNVKRSFFAQSSLSLLISNMLNYADYTKEYFGLNKHIGLLKVYQYYKHDNTIIQSHNALDDAIMLKYIYEQMRENPKEENDFPFPEYMLLVNCFVPSDLENPYKTFRGFPEAIKWVKSYQSMPKETSAERVSNKLKNAIDNHKKYCGFFWEIED